MEANVQYNDYRGTTAADACELAGSLGLTSEFIVKHFNINIDPDEFLFRGISVFIFNAQIDKVNAEFLFEKKDDGIVVKCERLIALQSILALYQRFEFQIGTHLKDINGKTIECLD